jgi:amidohydrolase
MGVIMDKSELKRIVCAEIDRHKDEITEIAERIFASPEMGYREHKTAELVKSTLSSLGIPFTDGLAVTGVMGRLSGRDNKARVAVIGELDAVTCSSHPNSDRISGAAHACGHNAQIAAMLGCAMGLSAVSGELDGEVDFLATPAEEYVEIGYRESLRDRGEIDFFGGKQELIRTGVFDNIDMAMMVHASGDTPENEIFVGGTTLGFVAKSVEFIGKAAHAASAPHEGVNALNAAMSAMMCIHAQRETFRDEDRIRVHPIITNGGELVNVVPSRVTMETYVRGASREAIIDASEKVDRAIDGASYAIGAKCEIKNYRGYLPLIQSEELGEIFARNSGLLPEPPRVNMNIDMPYSTDIGDLSHLMPVIQPRVGGFTGNLHAADFGAADETLAYINPAKIMAMTVIDLLSDGAEKALAVKAAFRPKMTKEEYCRD